LRRRWRLQNTGTVHFYRQSLTKSTHAVHLSISDQFTHATVTESLGAEAAVAAAVAAAEFGYRPLFYRRSLTKSTHTVHLSISVLLTQATVTESLGVEAAVAAMG